MSFYYEAFLILGLAYFCSNDKNDPDFDKATFLSFTLLPSPFPRKEYAYALQIQELWNKLILKVSNDYDFLNESLKE